MKKWIPWLVTGGMLCWVLSTLRPAPDQTGFDSRAFGRLPVLLNGRVQPMDSVARNALLAIRTRQTVHEKGKEDLTASQWLMEVMMKPEVADERPVFRMDHPDVLSMLKLPSHQKYFSFNELKPHWEEIQKQAERINGIDPKLRSPFEKQVFKLSSALMLYTRLENSMKPEGTHDFTGELTRYQQVIAPGVKAVQQKDAGEKYDATAMSQLIAFLSRYQFMSRLAYPLMVPPLENEKRNAWTSVGASLMETARSGRIHPAVAQFAAMSTAFVHGHTDEFNLTVKEYGQWLKAHQLEPEVTKGQREFFLSDFAPFYKSMVIYVLAFILAVCSWLNWSKWLSRSAFYLVILGFLLHSFGLVTRMVLEGRPPVTNLYSSAIFVGWGGVVLGLILERIYKDGIGSVVASTLGFLTLLIAHFLSLDGDTMEMLRAVLDTNFWLATHVVVVTLGYASTFVAGFLAILYIVRGLFTKSLTAPTAKSLTRMVYGIVCFATLFSFVGTILGGIWADQSWGRFWGWDPKENGALIIVLWNAVILHARWGGLVRERGLMNLAVFGNIVTSFSWFGVNMLGVGLHAYGFMDKAFPWLIGFVISQVMIIGLGLVPAEYWLSFRAASGRKASTTVGGVGQGSRPASAQA